MRRTIAEQPPRANAGAFGLPSIHVTMPHGRLLIEGPVGDDAFDLVVLAVDLDGDGTDEIELVVHGGLELTEVSRRPLHRFELWTHDGERRRLRETELEWSSSEHSTTRVWCGFHPAEDDPR